MQKPESFQSERRGDSFADMSFAIRRAFVSASVPVELRPKEVLFHAGDTGNGCYFLRRGAIKASVVSRDGQERLLAILGPGALIGELALIDNEPRSATVVALRGTSLLHLARSNFFRLADAHPVIYRFALRLLSQRLRGSNESVVAHGSATVAGRVARAFVSLVQGMGEELGERRVVLAERITQADIAGMAGVARENASRAINDLIRRGILGRSGGHYAVERPADLLELAEI